MTELDDALVKVAAREHAIAAVLAMIDAGDTATIPTVAKLLGWSHERVRTLLYRLQIDRVLASDMEKQPSGHFARVYRRVGG